MTESKSVKLWRRGAFADMMEATPLHWLCTGAVWLSSFASKLCSRRCCGHVTSCFCSNLITRLWFNRPRCVCEPAGGATATWIIYTLNNPEMTRSFHQSASHITLSMLEVGSGASWSGWICLVCLMTGQIHQALFRSPWFKDASWTPDVLQRKISSVLKPIHDWNIWLCCLQLHLQNFQNENVCF